MANIIKTIYGRLLDWSGLANVPAALKALAGLKGSTGQIIEISGAGGDGTVSSLTAVDKPAGNGATVPTKVSAFENDAGYTTEARVQELLAEFPTFQIKVVQELPAAGEEKTIYLVPFADDSGSYLEYLYVNGAWEVVGSGKDSGENVTEHRLNGHTMGVIGDSLSDPSRQVTQWFDWIATRAGGMEFVLDCVSGRRLMQFPSNTMSTACDVICVFGGTNDFNSAQSLGTIDDTTSDTFYGAVYKLATELRTNYPNALLVFITPMSSAPDYNSGENLKWHQFPQMGGHTVQDFADAIREVCGYLHIPVVDLFRDSGLNYNYDDPVDPYWVSDKLHLTSRGQEAISYVIEDTILRHYIPDNAQTGNVVSLVSIDAVFTQGDTIITTDSALSQLRDMLVVTANYSDGTSEVVTAYSLSGSISEVGTQTITVMHGGKRTTFDVTVGPSGAIDSTVLTLTVEAITEADIGETTPIAFDVGEDGSVTPNYVEWRAFWCLPLFDVSGATSITPDALEGPGRQAKTGQYVATPKLDCGVLYYDGDMNLIAYAICADTSYQYGTGDNRDENYVEVLKGSDVAELNGIPVVHYAMTKNYDYYGMNIASPIIPVPETAVFARVSFYPGSNNASGVLIGDKINVIISY